MLLLMKTVIQSLTKGSVVMVAQVQQQCTMHIQNRFWNSVQILAGVCGVVFGAGKGINGSLLQLEALQMGKKSKEH